MVDLILQEDDKLQLSHCIPNWVNSFVCEVVKNVRGFFKKINSKITFALLQKKNGQTLVSYISQVEVSSLR